MYRHLRERLIQVLADHDPEDCERAKRRMAEQWKRSYVCDLLQRKPYLAVREERFLERIADGDEIRPDRVSPRVVVCESHCDFDMFDYLTIQSSFPVKDRPGRRMKFMVVDDGHPRKAVMAIGCLASPVRHLRALDSWIGWQSPRLNGVKGDRLAYVMDLSTCVGLPPYSFLTSGKLAAYLSVSADIRKAYADRYASQLTRVRRRLVNDLALIVTAGAYGRNTPQYKGVSHGGRALFRFIGMTSGYSTCHIPSDLYKDLVAAIDTPEKNMGRFSWYGGSSRMRNLRYIARSLGINEDAVVRSGHSRALFVAATASNSREFLLGETSHLDYFEFGACDFCHSWKERWLSRRWASAQVREKVRAYVRRPLLQECERSGDAI